MLARRKLDIVLSSDQKRIVWHIKTHGPAARSAIALDLDMHNASVTRLTRELMMLGCLEEQDGQLASRGRPVVPLELSGRAGYAAGAMAHPGWLELVFVDFAGTVLARHHETFASADPRVFIERIGVLLNELALKANLIRSRFLGLGVAIAGPTMSGNASRRWTVKWLEGWREVDHPDFFESVLGMPVWVENEATLAGLADFYDSGLIGHCSSAISLFIGHGVGGSIILRRDVLSGEFGNSGDLGRLFPSLDQPRPSGVDLMREINRAGSELASLRDIETCLATHADVITAWLDRAAEQVMPLVASGAAWLDPGAIIVSGSLPLAILNAIGDRVRTAEWMFGLTPMPRPTFYVTKLGSWATPIGAAMLPIHAMIATAS